MATDTIIPDLIDDDRAAPDLQGVDLLFRRMDTMIERMWANAKRGNAWCHIEAEGYHPDFYRDLLVQVFHYTRYNSLNQAMTVSRATPEQRALLRFVYRHADEELGHEQMIVHDLRSAGLIGADSDLTTFPKVEATDALINYLVGVGALEGPVARLGYSYWAESVYTHIAPLLKATRESLSLNDRQMTFFVSHSGIDEGHAAEVRRIIAKVATTPAHHESIYRVARTSLWLTIELLEQTFAAWQARSNHG